MSDKNCVNCIGIETTFGCVKAAQDYPDLGIKEGDSLLDFLTPSTSETSVETEQEEVSDFNPIGVFTTSDCAMQLNSALVEYNVENLKSIGTLTYGLRDLGVSGYEIISSFFEITGNNGYSANSSSQLGKVTYNINNLPLSLSADIRVHTPCGQIKLTLAEIIPQSGVGTFSLTAVDLNNSAKKPADINEYVNSLYLKIQNLESKLRGVCDTMPKDNTSIVDNLLEDNTTKQKTIEQLQSDFVSLKSMFDELTLKCQTQGNEISDLRLTVSSLNNLN